MVLVDGLELLALEVVFFFQVGVFLLKRTVAKGHLREFLLQLCDLLT